MTRFRALRFLLVLAVVMSATTSLAARPKKKSPPPPPAAKVEPAPKAEPAPTPKTTATRTAAETEDAGRRGPARIEFDDRLVQGQTNKANAIYLFERRESSMRSLLKKRTNFHDEIDEMLEDELVR